MFSEAIQDVVRSVNNGGRDRRQFRTEDGIRTVIHSVDVGVCRLVPFNGHPVTMRDRHWDVVLGIELTDFGKEEANR